MKTRLEICDVPVGLRILQHFADHPNAKDTMMGMRCWWFLSSHADYTAERLMRTLDFLTATGLLFVHELPDQTRLFEANPRRRHDILKILRAGSFESLTGEDDG